MVPHTNSKHKKHHSRVYRPPVPIYKRPTVLLAAALTVYLLYRWTCSPSSAARPKAQVASTSKKAGPRSENLPEPHAHEQAIDPRASYHALQQKRRAQEAEAAAHAKALPHDGRPHRKATPHQKVEKKKSGAEVYEDVAGYVHYPVLGDTARGGRGQDEVRHPISWLIEEAEKKWDTMLKRQSKTLDQAVKEYQRRYGRKPPRGFDQWWAYARENGVVLVDEYDQIDRDISPFLSLPAELVLNRSETLLSHKGYMPASSIFAVEVKHGHASLLPGPNIDTSRAKDVLHGLQQIAKHLPDMRIPFTIEDGPGVAVSGEEKMMHAMVAKTGRKMSHEEVDHLGSMTDLTFPLWETVCPPNSAMRRAFSGEGTGHASTAGPSFVGLDHLQAMDLCEHPEHRLQHGQTLVEGNARTELFPLVSSSKTGMHSDILTTPMEQFYTPVGIDPLWSQKKHNKVLWRGSTTGTWHGRNLFWRASHRPRLVTSTNSKLGKRELLYAGPDELMRSKIVPEAKANAMFDVGYAGLPLQCNYAPGVDETCVYMKNQMRFEQHMSTDEGNTYKYVLDVDGNAWSGRFHRLMASSACVFKSTIYPEWWTTRSVPWYHYVPIKVDYSDLHNAAAYFIGVDGEGAHDDAGKKIGAQGKKWAEEHWREVDMQAYQLRVFLELARAMYGDREGSWDYRG